MANNEDYLDALTAYSKNPSGEIPPVLDQYLSGVAKNGETLFQWQLLKPLIVGKMEQVFEDLRQSLSSENIPERPNVENLRFDVMHDRIMDALHKFNGAPFTIQRLCELLIDPKQHYKRSDKFMRGLEKNVLVVSTVDPYGSRSHSDFFCRKVVSESGSKHLVNGVDTNGSPFFPRDSNISSNLPPVPGWVTTTAIRPQSTLAADSSEQKPTQKSSQDSPTAPSSAAVNTLYSEQGEQPPVVHSEEVIEETVVTMDTNEAGTVATDGGEAMAEEDDEEEMADDTNASSSSSSPEELSISDASESPGPQTEMATVTSSSETETKPWAVDSKEGENEDSSSSNIDSNSSNVTGCSQNSEKLSTELPPDKQTNSPPSSDANLNQTVHSEDDVVDNFAESEPEASSGESVQQSLNNTTCGVDTSTSATTENVVDHKDVQRHESESNDSSTASDNESDGSATGSDDKIPSSSSATQTAASSVDDLQSHGPSSSNICNDTEVNASSITDSISSNVTLLNSSEECDSVAGLERLVDSVESCQSEASLSSSTSVSTFLPTRQNTEQPESSALSSSSDSHLDSEEPQAKKCRMLDETSNPPISFTMSSTVESVLSEEMDASSSDDTPAGANLMAGTTSDTTSQIPAASSWGENSEIQESLDTISCSENDSDIHASVSDSNQENVTSPPSQLVSSGDSQGFDAVEDMVHKNSTDQEQTDTIQTQEATEIKTLIPETQNMQEPMDQE